VFTNRLVYSFPSPNREVGTSTQLWTDIESHHGLNIPGGGGVCDFSLLRRIQAGTDGSHDTYSGATRSYFTESNAAML
jgi:hypothetical protein